jgi:hypothetical protein
MELRPDYWREMAAQYRLNARRTDDESLAASLLKLADDCDTLAIRQEQILQHSNSHGSPRAEE